MLKYNNIRMEKMKKKILNIILMVFIVTGITGCGKVYKDDLVKKYSDYWDYSLGDYTYDYVWDSEVGCIACARYKKYTFYYTDDKGISKTFSMWNYNEEWTAEVDYMMILEEELTTMENEFLLNNKIDNINRYSVSSVFLEKTNPNISYFDPKKGVKIKSLSFDNLSSNNLIASIGIYIDLNKQIEEYTYLEENLIDSVKFAFDRFGYNNIKFIFNLYNPGEENRSAKYILSYNGVKYIWEYDYYKNDN